MKILNTVVAGLGRIGWGYHIPRILAHKGFKLTAIADTLPERLAEGETKYGVKGYATFSELLSEQVPDLAVIASPTPFHVDQAVMAMEKGVDVFLEKPMAATLEEADKIIEVIQRRNRRLMVFQPHRTTSEALAVKHLVDSGLIGPVYMIKRADVRFQRRNDWQALRRFHGGNLRNAGAHYIDQLLYTTGAKARKISCHLRNIASMGDAEDVVKILMETESGMILDLEINHACAQSVPAWIVLGERGTAIFRKEENNQGYFHVRYFIEEELGDLPLVTELAAPGRSYGNDDSIPWRERIINCSDFEPVDFYRQCHAYFAEGEKPFVPVEETREVMRIIDECHQTGWSET